MNLQRLLASGKYFDKDEGGGGDAPEATETPDSGASVRESMKKTASELSKNNSVDPFARAIGYFPEDEDGPEAEAVIAKNAAKVESTDIMSPTEAEDATDGAPAPEVVEEPSDDAGAPETDDEPAEAASEETEEPKKENKEGEEPSEPTHFYDPQVDAEGKDVYPNSYKSRQDAEYAIAAKIETFDDVAGKLDELDSDVGAAVPHSIQEKIARYRDVTGLGDASDEQVKQFIVDLDMSLKAVNEKHSRVESQRKTRKDAEQTTQAYKEAVSQGKKAVDSLNIASDMEGLPPDADFDDILALADKKMEDILDPLEQAVADHEGDTKFAEKNGHQQYLSKLRELETERDNKKKELADARKALVDWNDARIKKESLEKKTKTPTQKEKLQAMDTTFSEWMDDRSSGPFKLDLFDAPTTEPVKHLRKFAFAPSNINRFDLTTKQGWDQMHDYWKTEMETRFSSSVASKPKPDDGQDSKKKSSVDEPIPEPDPTHKVNHPPAYSPNSEISKINKSIKESSRKLFQ